MQQFADIKKTTKITDVNMKFTMIESMSEIVIKK